MNLKKIFGNNLKYYRKRKGLTQQEIADVTGLNRVYISEVERGRKNITIDVMETISTKMDIKISKMFEVREWTD